MSKQRAPLSRRSQRTSTETMQRSRMCTSKRAAKSCTPTLPPSTATARSQVSNTPRPPLSKLLSGFVTFLQLLTFPHVCHLHAWSENTL
ncbi:hypothetical protein L873DRAFT_306326 [Choiromyces venosus 120613-1]|uniref:Uncharacterized protein n=1 Tax=Choiromyces venosus 120613-1 TaxID=1336337 RepID=A0A3N4IZT5_9PEZI|nr:hypothetical protein L873DRAFT_306326 [Choiromyces venosus 120613-1]